MLIDDLDHQPDLRLAFWFQHRIHPHAAIDMLGVMNGLDRAAAARLCIVEKPQPVRVVLLADVVTEAVLAVGIGLGLHKSLQLQNRDAGQRPGEEQREQTQDQHAADRHGAGSDHLAQQREGGDHREPVAQ